MGFQPPSSVAGRGTKQCPSIFNNGKKHFLESGWAAAFCQRSGTSTKQAVRSGSS
jgi:hypothetical protein